VAGKKPVPPSLTYSLLLSIGSEEEGPGFCLCWVLPPASLLSLFSKLFIKLENGRDAEESQSTQQRDSDLLMQKPQKSNREKTQS